MKKIKIGLDFDGVVVYNPFRTIRAPITFFKRYVLKTKPKFWIPKSSFQKMLWVLLHKTSIFPAVGADLLKKMAQDPKYEFHLITGRYDFLANDLYRWLKTNSLKNVFKSINTNKDNEQPNLFKERMVKRLELDYYVEDNLDIVEHLDKTTKIKIFWIYNLFDRFHSRVYKYPHLKNALIDIT